MLGKENGRMLLNNVKLIEYDQGADTQSFFLQLGVVGFYATEQELHDVYGLLNYYFNIDSVNNTVISTD